MGEGKNQQLEFSAEEELLSFAAEIHCGEVYLRMWWKMGKKM
jgi:hypothetical protein